MRPLREAAHLLVSATGRKRVPSLFSLALDRVLAPFTGADADDILDRGDKDLAIADAPSTGGVDDCLNRAFQDSVLAHNLNLNLGEEIDYVFGATV